MADNAIRMECAHCFQSFETVDFYDHLSAEHLNFQHNKSINPQIVNN